MRKASNSLSERNIRKTPAGR